MNRRLFLTSGISMIALSRMGHAIEKEIAQLHAANLIGGATKIADRDSSAGYLVSLTQPGDGLKFTGLPAAANWRFVTRRCRWGPSASRSMASRLAR